MQLNLDLLMQELDAPSEMPNRVDIDLFSTCGSLSQMDVLKPPKLEGGKPILVINCSKNKYDSEYAPAGEIYKGDMFKFLKGKLNAFNVFIMSAKYGLVHSTEMLENYDLYIGDVDPDVYLDVHTKGIVSRLKSVCEGQPVYMVLSNAYKELMMKVMDTSLAKDIKKNSTGVYICQGHRGNGEQKERANLLIANHGKRKQLYGTRFRSGCANNLDEIVGYVSGGEAIGSSLYHIHDGKAFDERIVKALVYSAFAVPVFVDNGMLQCMKYKRPIDVPQMMELYREFVDRVVALYHDLVSSDESLTMSLRQLMSNFTFVLPDNPEASTSHLIEMYRSIKQQVVGFADLGVNWILPVHKTQGDEKLKDRTKALYDVFEHPEWIVLGVPTIVQEDKDLSWNTEQLESVLSAKDENKQRFVKRLHFLGQGDTTKKYVARDRVMLAEMYGVQFSSDSMRVRPIMTSNFAAEKGDEFAVNRMMVMLTSVIERLRQDEEDEPVIYENWKSLYYESVELFCNSWNAGLTGTLRSDALVSREVPVDDDEWIEEFVSSSFFESSYLDVWVRANAKELCEENGIKPVSGQQKRTATLSEYFNRFNVKPNMAFFKEFGEMLRMEVSY
ncbi:DUF6884 domain-containing protein [Vibrio barjaei]|uniref:DUF6884 domain-containing protein n=1 Tax=Vibrio barjaei TaxID=1676683 RepID=UPI0022845B88|nr:DUF6884 domain-containing protein [Vibrio barjaei]MCY9870414.1 hypothetical protein [Vibrio barjaei]